jgi:hypothetical protein
MGGRWECIGFDGCRLSAGVTIGAYLAVMQVLGLQRDLDLIGKDDPLGRMLQDAQLPARSRWKVYSIPQPP